jgi:hypothetical protein
MPELRIKKQTDERAKEQLAEYFEKTDKQLEKERIPGQEEFKNADRQRGIPLDSNELVRRITKINPFVWVEDSRNCPGHAGFYFSKHEQKFFSGAHFKKGMVFEFSRIYVDVTDRPVAVEYGWREVLHRLMKKKLITWAQIVKNFPIYSSQRSEVFDRQTQDLKEQT